MSKQRSTDTIATNQLPCSNLRYSIFLNSRHVLDILENLKGENDHLETINTDNEFLHREQILSNFTDNKDKGKAGKHILQ